MGDRVLRGSRLGAVSYESDRNTELAERTQAEYVCPKGHRMAVPLASDAEVPETWECRFCGSTATLAGSEPPEPKKTKPTRTHMDMLRERRSEAELEQILADQLAALHGEPVKKRKSA